MKVSFPRHAVNCKWDLYTYNYIVLVFLYGLLLAAPSEVMIG